MLRKKKEKKAEAARKHKLLLAEHDRQRKKKKIIKLATEKIHEQKIMNYKLTLSIVIDVKSIFHLMVAPSRKRYEIY